MKGAIGAVMFGAVLGLALPSPSQELKQVAKPPQFGTFWLLSFELDNRPSPPYPFDPYGGTLPIYEMKGFPGQYVVADTPEDYQQLRNEKLALRRSSLESGDDGGMEYTPVVYGTNDLWLQIIAQTNTTGFFCCIRLGRNHQPGCMIFLKRPI